MSPCTIFDDGLHGAGATVQSGRSPVVTVAPNRSVNGVGELKHTWRELAFPPMDFGTVIVIVLVRAPVVSNVTTAETSV